MHEAEKHKRQSRKEEYETMKKVKDKITAVSQGQNSAGPQS